MKSCQCRVCYGQWLNKCNSLPPPHKLFFSQWKMTPFCTFPMDLFFRRFYISTLQGQSKYIWISLLEKKTYISHPLVSQCGIPSVKFCFTHLNWRVLLAALLNTISVCKARNLDVNPPHWTSTKPTSPWLSPHLPDGPKAVLVIGRLDRLGG